MKEKNKKIKKKFDTLLYIHGDLEVHVSGKGLHTAS